MESPNTNVWKYFGSIFLTYIQIHAVNNQRETVWLKEDICLEILPLTSPPITLNSNYLNSWGN
jgi:hypothetical protein